MVRSNNGVNTPYLRDAQNRIRIRITHVNSQDVTNDLSLAGQEGWADIEPSWDKQRQLDLTHLNLDNGLRISSWGYRHVELDVTGNPTDGEDGTDFAAYYIDYESTAWDGSKYTECSCKTRARFTPLAGGVWVDEMKVCSGCKLPRRMSGRPTEQNTTPVVLEAPKVLMTTKAFKALVDTSLSPFSKDWKIENIEGETAIHTWLEIVSLDPQANGYGDDESGLVPWSEITPKSTGAPKVLITTDSFKEKMGQVFGALSKDWRLEQPDGEVVIHTGLMIAPLDPYADGWDDEDSGVLAWDELSQR